MASGYEKAECGIKPFTPSQDHGPVCFTRLVDLAILATGFLLMALKAYMIWRIFQ